MKVRQGTRRTQLGPRARARPWGDGTGVVQLVLVDQGIVPEPQELAGWIDALAADDAVDTVRTGALFPDAAARFAHAGFAVIDTLALLGLDLSTHGAVRADADRGRARTGPLPPRRHDDAASIDRRAFESPWANDGDDLAEIRAATPRHVARGRYVGSRPLERGRLVAFAISGAAAGHGYLQRLAVDPAHQREGHGRALTADSLRWMRRRHLRAALVNTSVDNEPALALYRSVGFRPRPERLHVMQLAVRSRR